jgi:two-component system nitrate/nitrite response regulator NarL
LTAPPRLLIADHDPTRLAIRMALDGQVEICAEAANAEQAIRAAKRQQPDVCLVGLEIPGGGTAAVRGICRAAPGAVAIVLGGSDDTDDVLAAIRVGAIGYVPNAVSAAQLRGIVAHVLAGEAAIPRSMVLELVLELRDRGSRDGGLTPREAQVLGMLRRGHETAEIARRLRITPVTVRRHVSDLVRRLGVENRSGLIPDRAALSDSVTTPERAAHIS